MPERNYYHSKFKGAAYERKISQRLSLWVSGPTSKRIDLFWRSAMSGGRARIRDKDGYEVRAQCGDITATHSDGSFLVSIFIIECKFYRNFYFDRAVFGRMKSPVLKFFSQLKKDGARWERTPLMICKQNRGEDIVCTTEKGINMLKRAGRVRVLCIFPKQNLYVFLLRDLLMLDYKVFEAQQKGKRLRL